MTINTGSDMEEMLENGDYRLFTVLGYFRIEEILCCTKLEVYFFLGFLIM